MMCLEEPLCPNSPVFKYIIAHIGPAGSSTTPSKFNNLLW